MSYSDILQQVELLPSSPIAIQALWDGDTVGWFVYLEAITADLQSHRLGDFHHGGDIRLINGQVPPWPEAKAARQLGQEIADRFGADFYFPSPNHPEGNCPTWHNRDKGTPCRRCGILLLQRESNPRLGICSHCHLQEKRKQHEATLTAAEQAGPRCHICGELAEHQQNGAPACPKCVEAYDVHTCQQCQTPMMRHKSAEPAILCGSCNRQNVIASLTSDQHTQIEDAIVEGKMKAIMLVIKMMQLKPSDAQAVVHMIENTARSEQAE